MSTQTDSIESKEVKAIETAEENKGGIAIENDSAAALNIEVNANRESRRKMSKVADKITKKYEKARAAGEDVAWVTDLSFRELIFVYSHLSFKAIKDGLDMPEEEKELLQSIVQRLKVSPFANNNDSNNEAESTTWEPEHANVLLLTTMLGQSHTQVSVNVHFFNKHGVITVWDGESKFLITKNFLEGKNILRVFNKSGQNAPITDGLLKEVYLDKVKPQLVAESNEKLYSLLRDCLDKFVQHRRDGFHKDDFITSSWMNENGFGQLVEKVLDTKPCLRVCNYTLAQEQEAYQREGACGAKQSSVQLVISNLTTGLSDVLWFDEYGENIFFKKARNSLWNLESIKLNKSVKELLGTRSLLSAINEDNLSKGYGSHDIYWHYLLVASVANIDVDKGEVTFDTTQKHNYEFYGLFAKPFTFGVKIVQDFNTSWLSLCKKWQDSDPAKVDRCSKKLAELSQMILVAHGYAPTKNMQDDGGTGYANSEYQALVQGYGHASDASKNKEKETLIEYVRAICGNKEVTFAHHPAAGKLLIKQFISVELQKCMGFTMEHKSLGYKNITDVMLHSYKVISEKWTDYLFTKPVDLVKDYQIGQDKVDVFYEKHSRYLSSQNIKSPNDKIPFGTYYAMQGGNLEKVYECFSNFWDEVLHPSLVKEFSTAVSNSDITAAYREHMANKGYPENTMISLMGEKLTIKEVPAAHAKAKNDGGLMTFATALPEGKQANNTGDKTRQKDPHNYLRQLAGHIEKLTEDISAEQHETQTKAFHAGRLMSAEEMQSAMEAQTLLNATKETYEYFKNNINNN